MPYSICIWFSGNDTSWWPLQQGRQLWAPPRQTPVPAKLLVLVSNKAHSSRRHFTKSICSTSVYWWNLSMIAFLIIIRGTPTYPSSNIVLLSPTTCFQNRSKDHVRASLSPVAVAVQNCSLETSLMAPSGLASLQIEMATTMTTSWSLSLQPSRLLIYTDVFCDRLWAARRDTAFPTAYCTRL